MGSTDSNGIVEAAVPEGPKSQHPADSGKDMAPPPSKAPTPPPPGKAPEPFAQEANSTRPAPQGSLK